VVVRSGRLVAGKDEPAWRCTKQTAKGPRAIGISVERIAFPRTHPPFVRCRGSDEGFTPVHVVVMKDSNVKFLASEAEVVWSEDSEKRI